jgi:hypothetical protein
MALRSKLRLSIMLECFFDTFMLLIFMVQAFVIGCVLIYGYLPLPTEWSNHLLTQKLPPGLQVHIENFRLHLDGTLELVDMEVHTEHIEQALLQAKNSEIKLQWNGWRQLPSPKNLLLAGGTLYIPSVYSPNGYHRPILEKVAFRLIPSETNWTVSHFAALHDNIRLRGSIELPRKKRHSTQALEIDALIHNFYTQAAKLTQAKERINYFQTPTIAFNFDAIDDQTQRVDLHISSRHLKHPEIIAKDIQLSCNIQLHKDSVTALTAPRLTATHLSAPQYQLTAQNLSAEFPPMALNGILTGNWPRLNLAAQQIQVRDFTLDAPTLQINPATYPTLPFHGSARSLNGAIALRGAINTQNWSGQVHARGSVDLRQFIPETISEKLPEISYDTPPDYDVSLSFNEGFALSHAEVNAQIKNLQIDQLSFDHIKARASYKDGRYSIDQLYLRRLKQWLKLKFSLDASSHNYRVTLIGSAVPDQYNTLLPHWWTTIFRDLDFSRNDYSLGDFIIYGNTQRKAADLYYGHVDARKVSYRGVLVDEGSLIVRGRGPYCELHELEARRGAGWAHGNIAFASRIGDGKGPMSVHLDMAAKLSLGDATKLFSGKTAALIADFKTEGLPITQFKGVIYNKKYPEFANKSYFDLTAALKQPLSYKGIPLEHLSFKLYGRSQVSHLRELKLGYANGQADAKIDIYTPTDAPNTTRYQFALTDAEQNLALQRLPKFGAFESKLQDAEPSSNMLRSSNESPDSQIARLDIQLHGQGPLDAPLQHTGFGRFEIRNENLSTIQLLGPLSQALESTYFNFTSFKLNQMHGDFSYTDGLVNFDPLRIDGDLTQINAPGTLRLSDQTLNMKVDISLFANSGNPESNLRKLSGLITSPITSLLQFELTGTLKDQKLRSLYDPRNLIPKF